MNTGYTFYFWKARGALGFWGTMREQLNLSYSALAQ